MFGNYTVPCGKYDVNTFNGTNSLDNEDTSDVEDQRVAALVFEEKCDADSFVMLDGQIINIQGNLTGPLEVEIVKGTYNPNDVVFEFYLDPENPWTPTQVLWKDLKSIDAAAEHKK